MTGNLVLLALAGAVAAAAAWQREPRLSGRPVARARPRPPVLVTLGARFPVRPPQPPASVDAPALRRAGMCERLSLAQVGQLRGGATVVFGGTGLAAALLLGGVVGPLVGVGMALFGWLYPELWVRSAGRRRTDLAERAAPVALDLVAATVSAGVTIDAALGAAAGAVGSPLCEELERVIAGLEVGRRRVELLGELAERTGSPSMERLAAALRISDRLGVPLADELRLQADRARSEQTRRVQERAAKATPRILLVVVFALVPAALLPVMVAVALTAADAITLL
jgi:tight adherence protein C